MRPQRSPLAQSLAAKVILSTVLLSLGVVWLIGSALYSQLSDGIKTVKIVNIKSNGDIIGRIDGDSQDFIVRDADKYLKKKLK